MKFGQNVTRKWNGISSCKTILKWPKHADFSKKSAKKKKMQILHIKFGLCDCNEHKNTKAYLI